MVEDKNKDCSLQACDCKPCKPEECNHDNECVCECVEEDKLNGEENGR